VSATFGSRPVFLHGVDALLQSGAHTVLVLAAADQLASAADALRGRAAVELVECPAGEGRVRQAASAGDLVVVHDPMCPLVPASVLRAAVDSWEPGTASVAVLDLVDTVKTTRDEVVRSTLDRGALRSVGSPVVLPSAALNDLADLTAILSRPAALVAALAGSCPVRFVTASPLSIRAEDASSLRVLASYGDPAT
jgi:2-C-methyl-D-erythritol 4-phosphate cytidylyltransferase